MDRMERWNRYASLSEDERIDVEGGRRRVKKSRALAKRSSRKSSIKKPKAASTFGGKSRYAPQKKRALWSGGGSGSLPKATSKPYRTASNGGRKRSATRGGTVHDLYRGKGIDQNGFEARYGFKGNSSCLTVSFMNLYRYAPGGFDVKEVDHFVQNALGEGVIHYKDGSPRNLDRVSRLAAQASGSNTWYHCMYRERDGRDVLVQMSAEAYQTGFHRGTRYDGVVFQLYNHRTGEYHYVTGDPGSRHLEFVDPLNPNRTYRGTTDRIRHNYDVVSVIPLVQRRL